FLSAHDFSEGLAAVKVKTNSVLSGEKYGFIDRTGKFAIEPQFDSAWGFREGLAAVKLGTGWGYIDRTGKVVVLAWYGKAGDFSQGVALVETNLGIKLLDKRTCRIAAKDSCQGTRRSLPTPVAAVCRAAEANTRSNSGA
ncbi:MAG: WG repeat-containing protein, partial [Gemmatimonadaceae bacterium]|nr:WG repeat-containing protein [Gloeobacterales cyanobacterium ES-bin-141]